MSLRGAAWKEAFDCRADIMQDPMSRGDGAEVEMANESVLITGGTGLIGSNLAGQLAANGYDVTVLGRSRRFAVPDAVPPGLIERIKLVTGDLTDPETLEELVKKADIIFHKAASVGMAGAAESARAYVGDNLAGTANLVDVLRGSGKRVKKVVLGSSISVYGEGNYSCEHCGIVRPQLRGGHATCTPG
jgi:dTDP-L-rhamnose 4-epimerase